MVAPDFPLTNVGNDNHHNRFGGYNYHINYAITCSAKERHKEHQRDNTQISPPPQHKMADSKQFFQGEFNPDSEE
jgi:hypothetical protein